MGRHMCWSRAVIRRLAGAAILLVALSILVLTSTPFRNGLARPPLSSGAIGPEATAMDWVHRGNDAIRRRRLGEAEDALERAKRLDPTLAAARQGLIRIHVLRMRRDETLAEFAALADLRALDFDEALLWCQVRCSIWSPEKVVPQLRELLEVSPDDRGVRLALAEGCRRLGRTPEALEALEVLAVLGESDPDAWAIRARLAIDQGDASTTEAILSLGPADHPDLAELRGQLAMYGHDGRTAVDRFRRAVAAEPDNRRHLNGLAQALRLAGQDRSAEPLLERIGLLDALIEGVCCAAEMTRREDPSLFRDLGAACAALGLSAEARTWYHLALDRDPLDRETQAALFRLRSASSKPAR
jgi:tetratricopeptide (TPR) repeat protein